MDDFEKELLSSLQTGFINKATESQDDYQPQLVTNNLHKQKTVLSTLQRELSTCKAFYFSVAFVTKSGLCGLLNTLVELQKNDIPGKILVSQYQNITQPQALRQLLKLTNIKLRIAVKGNHHAKGYIFEQDHGCSMLVGSSNLTSHALKSNKEWNLKLTSARNGKLVEQTVTEFWDDFNNAVVVDEEFIAQYESVYQAYKKSNYTFHQKYYDVPPKPNKMQIEALSNLESLRKNGHTKGLLVSATGTGKTYLSAFDAQKVNPQRLLFVVHRANITNAAMETYQKVFKQTRSMGMYSGQNHNTEADFLFATIQTISRDEHLNSFVKDHFDYIVIDETHRAGAKSYLKIMEYFQPKFLLGLTATPERTDGFDIFKEFDHNIVYEIRLHRAMSEGMLCDFHYYGIADIFTEQDYGDDISFDMLVAEERVKHIIDKIKFYGCDSSRTCGLIFCSSNEESKQLSTMFNMQGFRTKYLTGQSSEDERIKAIEQLESDDANSLDYIFTRDIFNEGIDIPCVNQIIMLRPTQSAIIFVQQLGRGLRKYPHKEYLTVLDFIGNYSNNFFIPIALFGDTSYNKDSLRKMMVSASCVIPGTSTVNFEHIVKQKIFSAIDKAKLSQKKDLRKDYEILKFKIGRVPMMMDFQLR